MTVIPANPNITALVHVPGTPDVIFGTVVAWEVADDGRLVPPKPIVVPCLHGARVAVRFGEHPRCFEWPDIVHESTEAFRSDPK